MDKDDLVENAGPTLLKVVKADDTPPRDMKKTADVANLIVVQVSFSRCFRARVEIFIRPLIENELNECMNQSITCFVLLEPVTLMDQAEPFIHPFIHQPAPTPDIVAFVSKFRCSHF